MTRFHHYRWSIVYPSYINSKKTAAEGRRVPKDKVGGSLGYRAPRLESLEIARWRFRKFNSKYIESIKIARRRYPPRDTNFPHW